MPESPYVKPLSGIKTRFVLFLWPITLEDDYYEKKILSSAEYVDYQPCAKRKGHDKFQVNQEPFPAQHDLHRAKICDLCGRASQHKGCSAAHTHAVAVRQPFDQQRDRAAAAHINWHPNSCSHQHAEAIVLSEQTADEILRNMNLVQRCQ